MRSRWQRNMGSLPRLHNDNIVQSTEKTTSVLLRVSHVTRYIYPGNVCESFNEVRMMPKSDSDQDCLEYQISSKPQSSVHSYCLPTGMVHHFEVRYPHTELEVRSRSLVKAVIQEPLHGLHLIEEDMDFYLLQNTHQQYCEYLLPTQRVPVRGETDRFAAQALIGAHGNAASFLINLTRVIHGAISYQFGITDVESTIKDVLNHGYGVCQDYAHLMLDACRGSSIPARYVSGYLHTGKQARSSQVTTDPIAIKVTGIPESESPAAAPVDIPFEEELLGADAMHAWVECLLPDGTWRGFDPTNNILTDHKYIKVHFGRDYGDVIPFRGVYRGPLALSMDVAVNVSREFVSETD